MHIVRTLLGFVGGMCRSPISLQIEIVALPQQLAIYKRSIRSSLRAREDSQDGTG